MGFTKKRINEMMPVKKWLSLDESISFLDMSKTTFLNLARQHRLTVSHVGGKRYYLVLQLETLIEENILIKQ